MNKLLLLVIILIVGLASARYALTCPKGKLVQYTFVSDVTTFGAKPGEHLSVKGTVDIQCKVHNGLRNFFVGTEKVVLSQKAAGTRYEKAFAGSEKEYSVFTLSKNGRLLRFMNSNKPDSSQKISMVLYNIRKSVASFYQMDTRRGKRFRRRVEKSAEGLVNARYTYSFKNGLRRIVRRVKSRDVIKKIGAQKLERRRDSKFRLTTAVLYRRGRIQRVNQRFFSVVGTNKKGNKKYEKLKKQFPKMKPKSENHERVKSLQNVESASRFIYKKTIKVRKERNILDESNSHVEDLSMSQATHDFALQSQKEKLERTTDFPEVLRKLQSNPKDIQIFNKALEYTKSFSEKSLGYLIKEYKTTSDDQLKYKKVLHTLLASTQSPVAEKVLLEAMKNPTTAQSAMTSIVGLQNPSDQSVHALQAFSEEKSLGVLSSQAYLLFAHMASKTQNKLLAQHILGHISMNMHNARDANGLGVHIKALANAGNAVPVSVLERLIHSNHITLDSRVDATHALQHHTLTEEATVLVHKIIQSDLHEEIKTAAIHAQTEREKVLENRASVKEFKHLQSKTESAAILSAISDYFEEAEVTDDGEEDNTMEVETQANTLGWFRKAFRSAKRWVKKAARRVKRAVKKVGRAIKKAAKAVADSITSVVNKAKNFFTDLKNKIAGKVTLSSLGKSCIRSTGRTKLCTYNKHYMKYVRSVDRKFRLSTYSSSNNHNIEKVFGIRLLFVYFGSHGYAASKQPVKCSDENLKFLAIQRSDLQVGLMGRRFSLFAADAYINVDRSRTGNNRVKDKFRLTLMGKLHMWDLELVPKKMKNFKY
eukprot:gene2063-1935_t